KNGSVYLAGPLIADKLGLQLAVNKQERNEDRYVGGFRSTERESLNSRLTYAAIERIEIIRGPASTLYGTDAMGGVVNIITKKVSDEWSGNIELGTIIQDSNRSGDIKNGSVYLAGPLIADKLGLQLAVNKQERNEDRYV
ncbi:hypothetical protein D9B85_13385, partial [Corynebacterium diphtheriae]